MVIRRVGVMSAAKLMGLLYAGIGVIIGLLFALFSVLGGGAMMAAGGGEEAAMGGGAMMGMGIGFAIVAPIFYGVAGFIGGALSAWLYNIAAKYAGGIEIDVS
jgi:hypothetical protein